MTLARTLRTVRHLRAAQLYGQLRRRIRGPARPRRAGGGEPRLAVARAAVPFLPPAAHARSCTATRVCLLSREVAFPGRVDWLHAGEGPLWQFHLHYHEWLRGDGIAPGERDALLRDWMRRHAEGVGWGPAPTSLRVFQWAKLLATPGALEAERAPLLRSLADQLATLAGALEYDLLANHLLFNRLALVLGGVLLEGSEAARWLASQGDLLRELGEQVGADGGHCERSPMYHALVLEAVLDLLNLVEARPGRLEPASQRALRDVAARMCAALAFWTHPDGEIALFGDSAFGVAADPAALSGYAEALGVAAPPAPLPAALADAGFVRLAAGPWTCIASVAGPLPAHQPGHAHCDALSFELSLGAERIVTDTGVAEYVPGARRDASRATRSHATLEIGGADQAELWGAHRIGGRPRVRLVRADAEGAVAECAGWATPRTLHRRSFAASGSGAASLEIRDEVEGRAADVLASLPLAPGVSVAALEPGAALLAAASGARVRVELPGSLTWRVEDAPYFPAFGRSESRPCLRGRGRAPCSLRWRFATA